MRMLCLSFAVAVFLLAAPAWAQTPAPRPKPYAAVAITLPARFADPSFVAFRTSLAAAAKSRRYADLEALVQPQGFFWDRDFGNGFDPRKPPVDNLAAAIRLEHDGGAGWERLAKFAEEPSVMPLDSRPGVMCAPAKPGYDALEYSRLLDTTTTTETDWAYPVADGVLVRGQMATKAPIAGKLAPHFVRLLGWTTADSDTARYSASAVKIWARVALPDGSGGYVEPSQLSFLTVGRLCYIKDMVAGWRITGFVGGGN